MTVPKLPGWGTDLTAVSAEAATVIVALVAAVQSLVQEWLRRRGQARSRRSGRRR